MALFDALKKDTYVQLARTRIGASDLWSVLYRLNWSDKLR